MMIMGQRASGDATVGLCSRAAWFLKIQGGLSHVLHDGKPLRCDEENHNRSQLLRGTSSLFTSSSPTLEMRIKSENSNRYEDPDASGPNHAPKNDLIFSCFSVALPEEGNNEKGLLPKLRSCLLKAPGRSL